MKVVRKDIDVLCWFDQNGYPNPIRFRMEDEFGMHLVVKIEKVITREYERLAGNRMYVFTCQCVFQGLSKTIVIKYELDHCKWILFKL